MTTTSVSWRCWDTTLSIPLPLESVEMPVDENDPINSPHQLQELGGVSHGCGITSILSSGWSPPLREISTWYYEPLGLWSGLYHRHQGSSGLPCWQNIAGFGIFNNKYLINNYFFIIDKAKAGFTTFILIKDWIWHHIYDILTWYHF